MQRSAAIRSTVRLAVRSAILLGALAAAGASAQQAATDDQLTATQKLGRQVFAQSCGICHLPPQINARTYGPLLSKGHGRRQR
jgi:mono/diheme cytochrome c family protein